MSYASKAQLKALAEAIKQKFAKKIDPEAISGNAQQLLASIGVTDEAPYNLRTSGGFADIGNRLNDKLVGGTINWNQLIKNGNFASSSEWSTFRASSSVADNTMTVTVTAGGGDFPRAYQAIDVVAQHKYLEVALVKSEKDTVVVGQYHTHTITPNVWNDIGKMFVASGNSYQFGIGLVGSSAEVGDSAQFKNVQLFDLTAMFGSTIADYVYSLEQATAGAGIAWFKKLLPRPYYEYNAGELMSVCTNEHITRGFNAWDEEWEAGQLNTTDGTVLQSTNSIVSKNFIPILPSTGYYFRKSNNNFGNICFYDINKVFISSLTWSYAYFNRINTMPSNAYYMKFATDGQYGATYRNDICINLSWSGYRNGEYEPYMEHRYPLSPVELRGIPKLDSANNLYYDGDTYAHDGTVTRKYGIIDLGTLNWTLGSFDNVFISGQNVVAYHSPNILCNKYATQYSSTSIQSVINDKHIATNGVKALVVKDTSYNDPATFKAAMSGVYLVYELATPTTETADPFTDPQIVDDFGTEEYVDALATAETNPRDVAVPVGHETFYQANLRDKLQNLPANANADGLYLVKQTGNKQELIAYTPESELPTVQTEGTYALKSVNGVLTWVLES